MLLDYGGKTDLGKVRTNNEDNFTINEAIGLCVVADGMGGANAGEVASRMASDIISNSLSQAMSHQNKKKGQSYKNCPFFIQIELNRLPDNDELKMSFWQWTVVRIFCIIHNKNIYAAGRVLV